MANNPQLLSGARGIIQLNGSALAFATDITVNVREGVRQTYVMGKMNAGAIDSLSYDVDVSVGRVYPVNDKSATRSPDGSVAARAGSTGIEIGLEEVISHMVSADSLTIVLQDKVTGKTISSVQGCRFSGRSFTMNSGDVAQERYNFVGIYDAGYSGTETSAITGYDSTSA